MKIEVELHSDYADRIVIASLKKSLSYLSAGRDNDLRRCIMQSLSFYLSADDFAVFERSLSVEDIEEALREQARVRHLEFFGDPKEETLEWKAADEIQRLRNLIDELTQKRCEEEIVGQYRFEG
jgi:hypothetical protein